MSEAAPQYQYELRGIFERLCCDTERTGEHKENAVRTAWSELVSLARINKQMHMRSCEVFHSADQDLRRLGLYSLMDLASSLFRTLFLTRVFLETSDQFLENVVLSEWDRALAEAKRILSGGLEDTNVDERRASYGGIFIPKAPGKKQVLSSHDDSVLFRVGDREKKLLFYLWSREGRSVSTDALWTYVYDDAGPGKNALQVLRNALNKKLALHGLHIRTDQGVTYALVQHEVADS